MSDCGENNLFAVWGYIGRTDKPFKRREKNGR